MALTKLKTVFTTGAWLPKVKTFYEKINEIIDYLNGIGKSGDGSYKKYVALLTQSSTNAPTVVILENTLDGTIVWTRDSAGSYYGTLTGAFTVNKTVVLGSKQFFTNERGGVITNKEVTMDRYDADSVFVSTSLFDVVSSGTLLDDGILASTPVEIRVYN